MKIVITDADTVTGGDLSLDRFEKFGELKIYGLTGENELIDRIKDADIVLCNKTLIGRKAMEAAGNLKMIGLFATGYNNIDTVCAHERGIAVCNVPGYSTEAVAQHAFAFILALLNRVGEYNETVREGDWIRSRTFSYFPLPLKELAGKTLGIIGYGSIGRRVGDIALAFGMNVLAYNRHGIDDPRVTYASLDDLYAQSDIITLHCPLNDDSRGMINRDAIAKMKDGVYLINTARGPLVNEKDLREALESGKVAGAGVDVLCKEPMDADCPLYQAPNCLITPHIAWAGLETRRRLLDIVEDNICALIAGKPIHTV